MEPNYSLPTKNDYQTTLSDSNSVAKKRSYTNAQPSQSQSHLQSMPFSHKSSLNASHQNLPKASGKRSTSSTHIAAGHKTSLS